MLFPRVLFNVLLFGAVFVAALPQTEPSHAQDVLKCRRVLKDALAEELSIENVPIPDIEDRQSADRRDGVERDQEIHEGYCSAGTTQRCNYCENGRMEWKKCAQNHRCTKTGHYCNYADSTRIAICS